MAHKNYYDILGVSTKASLDEITAAKNALAKKFHPDVNLKDGIDTTEQMQEILEAYRILSDPAKRKKYDRKMQGRTAVMQTFDLQLNEEHPEIQVSREAIDRSDSYAYDNKIATAVTSNDLPDIFYVDGPQVSYYAANGITVPLDDYFTDEDKADFVKSSMTQNTYDGKLYAVGATESSVAFYYNKDYLKECGVDTDDLDSRTLENPLTTDEVAEIAEKCTTDDYVGTHIIMDHGEGLPYALEPLYLSAGKDYISEDGKEADGYVNSEEAVNTTAWLADLIA